LIHVNGGASFREHIDMRHHVSTTASAQGDPAELTTPFTIDGKVPATSVRTSVAVPNG